MLTSATRFLGARATVLALMLLLTAALAAEALGLGRVLATPWFAAVAALSLASLATSAVEQARAARRRLRQLPAAVAAGGASCALPREALEALLRREGYRRVAAAPGRSRHVKHRAGYWGTFLLHAGLAVTILFALTYVLTEHRLTFKASGGPGQPLEPEAHRARRGLLAGLVPLPRAITLLQLAPAFHEDDALRDLASQVILTDEDGGSAFLQVALNEAGEHRGLVVHQASSFGQVFDLEFTGPGGVTLARSLELPYPTRRDAASYGAFPLGEGPAVRAKSYARADRAGMGGGEPLLVLRLVEGSQVLAEAALQRGERAALGPWQVHLAGVRWWTVLLLDGSLGTSGLFAGFAILLAGGALALLATPREALLEDGPRGCTLRWRAARFGELYREEGERLLARCQGGPAA